MASPRTRRVLKDLRVKDENTVSRKKRFIFFLLLEMFLLVLLLSSKFRVNPHSEHIFTI